jgi:hypothetical protein
VRGTKRARTNDIKSIKQHISTFRTWTPAYPTADSSLGGFKHPEILEFLCPGDLDPHDPEYVISLLSIEVPNPWLRTVKKLRERTIVPNSEALPRFCWVDSVVDEKKLLKGFGYGKLWVTVRRGLPLSIII